MDIDVKIKELQEKARKQQDYVTWLKFEKYDVLSRGIDEKQELEQEEKELQLMLDKINQLIIKKEK